MPGLLPELSEQAAQILQSAWDLFFAAGDWPTVGEMARHVDRLYGIDLETAVRGIPPGFLRDIRPEWLPPDNQPFGLTVAGAASVRGADDEVQAFVQAVRLAADLDRTWQPPSADPDALPTLTPELLASAVPLPAAGRSEVLRRVGALLLVENWGWSGASRSSEWSFTVDRRVRRFRDVTDVTDYLRRAHPMQQASASASASARQRPYLPETDSEQRQAMTGDRRNVFLVHGRDNAARTDMVALLRALDLRVVSWRDAAARAGGGTPYTGDVVRAGMDLAAAVVVLLTPDDVGYVRPEFRQERDGPDDLRPTGQARLNVIFEAGMAMARDRDKVVIVEVGATRALSDTAGLNVVRLDDGIEARRDLAGRLRAAHLDVDTDREEWRTVGTFTRKTLNAGDLAHAPTGTGDHLDDVERRVLRYLAGHFRTGGTRLDSPFEVPGLTWEETAVVLADLHDSDPPYLRGIDTAEHVYPAAVTALTERGRAAARA